MAKKPKVAASPMVPDVVDAEPQDLAPIQTDGDAIKSFLGLGLTQFLRTARSLEMEASARVITAKGFLAHPPTDQASDEAVQRFIIEARGGVKAVEGHWSITTAVHRLHRLLTAARDRGAKANADAADIAQRVHNMYADNARRAAAAEQERVRREAEAKAAEDRQKELDELERQAVASEEASPEVSDREEQFVASVMATGDPIKAASTAGYKDPFKASARLLSMPKILQAIAAAKQAAAARQQRQAIAATPVHVEVETVKADVSKVGSERTTWSAEVLDEAALVEAVFSGKYGIPRDVLTVNQAKVNQYADAMHELIDRWPGVRSKKTTRTHGRS